MCNFDTGRTFTVTITADDDVWDALFPALAPSLTDPHGVTTGELAAAAITEAIRTAMNRRMANARHFNPALLAPEATAPRVTVESAERAQR